MVTQMASSGLSTTSIVHVSDISYLISQECCGVLRLDPPLGYDQRPNFLPVTVINLEDGQHTVTGTWLQGVITGFLDTDDVVHETYIKTLLLKGPGESITLTEDVEGVLSQWGSTLHFMLCSDNFPSGPYAIDPFQRLHPVFRLYPDPQLAFMCGTIPSTDQKGFRSTHMDMIPVPSRLYSEPPSTSQPLNGKRIAVKDVFDIAGMTTSAGVRAFDGFYGPTQRTAPAIQHLIDQGAIIVGKTKTVQLASGENPMDWVDYQCPFNPRGDGYFTTAGSSTGSAAALAAYDWLDITIGTDSESSVTFFALIVYSEVCSFR